MVFNIRRMDFLVFKGLESKYCIWPMGKYWLRWEVSKELAGWKGIRLPSDSEPRTA